MTFAFLYQLFSQMPDRVLFIILLESDFFLTFAKPTLTQKISCRQVKKKHKTNKKTQNVLQSKICKDLNLFNKKEEKTKKVALFTIYKQL